MRTIRVTEEFVDSALQPRALTKLRELAALPFEGLFWRLCKLKEN